jgi:SdrD B-like domain
MMHGMKKKLLGVATGLLAVVAGGMAFANNGGGGLRVSLSTSTTSVVAGGRWDYNIGYSCASSNDTCKSAVIGVTIPDGVSVVTLPQVTGGRAKVVGSGQFIQIVFGEELLDGTSGVFTATVSVPTCLAVGERQPSSSPARAKISGSGDDGRTESAEAVSIAQIPDCAGGDGSCLANCDAPIDLARSHWKWGSDAAPGGVTWWSLDIAPRPVAFDVIDELPAGLIVSEVGAWSTTDVDVRCGGTWYPITYSLSGTNVPAPCQVGLTRVGATRYPAVTAVRVHVKAKTSANIGIATILPLSAVPGSTIENCAVADLGSERFCFTINVLKAEAVPDPRISLVGSPEKALDGSSLFWGNTPRAVATPSTPMGVNDLAFLAGVRSDQRGGADLINPVIVVDLSPEQSFVSTGSTPNWQVAYASPAADWDSVPGDPRSQPGCMNPTFAKRVVGGHEKLTWTFLNCTIRHDMRLDGELEVFFSTRIKPGVLAGTHVDATIQIGFASSPNTTQFSDSLCSSKPVDTSDLDGDGLTTDALCGGGVASYRMPTHAELTASNTVQGALDERPTLFPMFGSTGEAGDATYSINLKNTGTIQMQSVDLVSILPFAGDNVIGDGVGSDWDMKLSRIASVTRVGADGVAIAVPATDFKLAFSGSKNPCRFDSDSIPGLYAAGAPFAPNASVTGPVGCTADPWQATQADAKSWALQYLPADPLLPGEELRVSIEVSRAGNIGDPLPNGVAWNSVAFSGATINGTRLLSNQPKVGGVRIVDTAPSLAGLVWKDANDDGLRQDIERGIEGVTVEAIDDAGLVAGTATTDNHGTYFISGLLPAANYTLRFTGSPLRGLDPAKVRQGADTTRDSDAVRNGSVIEIPNARTSARYVSGGLDLGLIAGEGGPDFGAT